MGKHLNQPTQNVALASSVLHLNHPSCTIQHTLQLPWSQALSVMPANHFPAANRLLHTTFGYCLNPAQADHFRAALIRCGYRRFQQAVRLTVLEAPENAQEAHTVLEGHMWQLTPRKRPTAAYRNPQANAMRALATAMDARVMELVADPRQ